MQYNEMEGRIPYKTDCDSKNAIYNPIFGKKQTTISGS
jgi:hypothetical protein